MFRFKFSPCDLDIQLRVEELQLEPSSNEKDLEPMVGDLQSLHLPQEFTVHLQEGQELNEVVYDLIRHRYPSHLPFHIYPRLYDALCQCIDSQLQRNAVQLQEKVQAVTEEKREKRIRRLAACYRKTHSAFAVRDQKPTFQQAMATLIAANDPAFDLLLQMEEGCTRQLQQYLEKRNQALEEVSLKHQLEIQAITGADGRRKKEVTLLGIPARQQEEMTLLELKWDGQLDVLRSKQRNLFQTRALQLLDCYLNSLVYDPNWASVEEFFKDDLKQEDPVQAPIPQETAPVEIAPSIDDSKVTGLIAGLQDMGFTTEQSRCAITLTSGDMDRAIVLLLEDPDKISDGIARGLGKAPEVPSLPKRPISEASTSRGWSPISFLEQQIANNPAAKSNLKRIGSWIDKAKAQIEEIIDDGDSRRVDSSTKSEADYQHLVESFTISMGSQIRYTYNLRLMVGSMNSFFRPPQDEGALHAIRAQTLATLYSRGLTAVVVLVPTDEWTGYSEGKSSNKELFEQCNRTAELHFESIGEQLQKSASHFVDPETGSVSLKEGDVLITRHSNLPLVHIVFHLFTTGNNLYAEFSQQSPLIGGVRHVLLTMSRYDISQISLPLMLLPDKSDTTPPPNTDGATSAKLPMTRSTSFSSLINTNSNSPQSNQQTVSQSKTVNRRADIALKCSKANLLECSRSYGRHSAPSASNTLEVDDLQANPKTTPTLQFALHPQYTTEETFENLKMMVKQIYRAS